MGTCALLLIAAVALDAVLGDPAYALHPVRLIGWTIGKLEPPLRAIPVSEFWRGTLFTFLILIICEGILIFLYKLLSPSPLRYLFILFVIYSCFALRDLSRHIQSVVSALEKNDIPGAQKQLQKIVGRNTAVLNRAGIIRAAIETTAEGFVDGFLAPIFWYVLFAIIGKPLSVTPCLFGLMGILGYRAVNTLDSMIGYKNENYLYFGRFAAKLDDVVNFIPARLSVLFLFLGAWILGKDPGNGLDSVVKYHRHAASPNAGYPESFVAGAFHIQLGGPVQYPFGKVDKPWIGNDTIEPTPDTVRKVSQLITLSGYLAAVTLALFSWVTPAVIKKNF